MTERSNRDHSVRSVATRKKSWQPPTLLPDPPPDGSYRYKWVRVSTLGNSDVTNSSKKLREGWEWVSSDDPIAGHIKIAADKNPTLGGIIEVGGLALARMPEEMAQEREAYFSNLAGQQIESVERSYMKESDPRMPVLKPERKTEITS
jgi:hypothetical protein